MDIDALERAASAAKEFRSLSNAIDLASRAKSHNALIWNIQAEDPAESERSIPVKLNLEESQKVFDAIVDVLTPRLEAAKAKIAAA